MSLPTRYFIDLTQPEIAAQLNKKSLVLDEAEGGTAEIKHLKVPG